jgi:hypothetical protein
VIGRLVPVLAAWLVLRSVIDFSEGYTPLASILFFWRGTTHPLDVPQAWLPEAKTDDAI